MQSPWDPLLPYARLMRLDRIEPRAYQIAIMSKVLEGRNTLVVLPTGMGKTLIAVFAAAKALYSGSKALVLAPTKPLSAQHSASLLQLLDVEPSNIALFTGAIAPQKRASMLNEVRVIAATPQTVSHDIEAGRISLEGFGVVVFDECHRSVGRYAYTTIAEECKRMGIQLIGLTASPGSNPKTIRALLETLGIKSIELRLSTDPDVAPYVAEKDTTIMYVEKGSTVASILDTLLPLMEKHIGNLYSHGLSPFRSAENLPRGRLLEIGNAISKIAAKNYRFMAMADYMYVLHVSHAYDLASTQGIYPFVSYLDALEARAEKGRMLRSILSNQRVRDALAIGRAALQRGEEHPKMHRLVELLNGELSSGSIIVFAQYRSTIRRIVEILSENGVEARQFTGKRDGFTQEMQKSTIEEFSARAFRVLVASSIGEEGLDIPAVDAVVFYEPVPSEIRAIQRRGRTGRLRFGRVFIMVARGTKDERYLIVSRMRERRMAELLNKLKRSMESGEYGRAPRRASAFQRRLGDAGGSASAP